MEIDGIPARVVGVVLQQILEAINRPRIPALPEVEEADEIVRLAQSIPCLAQLGAHFRHELAVRIAIDERLELSDRLARFGLIALGAAHLFDMRKTRLV